MLILSKTSCFVAGFATVTLLAGCSGGSGIVSPTTNDVVPQSATRSVSMSQGRFAATSVLRPGLRIKTGAFRPFVSSGAIANATGNTIAVSDSVNNVVDIFTAGGKQTGQLTGFSEPQGLASDIKGNLYIADTVNSRIQVYPAGLKTPPTSIADTGQYPSGVDSFANGQYIAVSNIISTTGGAGSISIFKGSTLVSNITSSNIKEAMFCAFDATGNLYVSAIDSSNVSSVGEIPNATSGGKTYIDLASGIGNWPGGVQVTTNGQIAVEDSFLGVIYTYNAPAHGSLGRPVATTTLVGNVIDPVTFVFTKDMNSLYAADAGVQQANQFAYPSGSQVSTIAVTGGTPSGIAVIPTQYPEATK